MVWEALDQHLHYLHLFLLGKCRVEVVEQQKRNLRVVFDLSLHVSPGNDWISP